MPARLKGKELEKGFSPVSARLNYYAEAPDLMKELVRVSETMAAAGLDRNLLELTQLRVSQINGCAFCIGMHWSSLEKAEIPREKMVFLSVWDEADVFSAAERAALAWAEALTNIVESRASDEVYHRLSEHFTSREIVQLSLAITLMNGWNRLAVGFRKQPLIARKV